MHWYGDGGVTCAPVDDAQSTKVHLNTQVFLSHPWETSSPFSSFDPGYASKAFSHFRFPYHTHSARPKR